MKRLALVLLLVVPWLTSSPVPQTSTRDITISITKRSGAIHVQNQDGQGLLFYRGLTEVREYLNTKPFEQWEIDMQSVIRERLKGDPTLSPGKETFTYQEPSITVKR